MIQLIFNATPETSTIPWAIIVPIVCVFLGAGLGLGLTLLKECSDKQKAIKKEQKEFERIKKLIPKVMQVVKKGLDKNLLATELQFYLGTENYNPRTGDESEAIYSVSFGKYEEQISEELYNTKDDIMLFLENNYLGMRKDNLIVVLNSEFLAKVQNEAKPR